MQKLKLCSNQSGVSMVMVLMGFALAGVISVAMMKMNEVGLKRVKTREAVDDRREFLQNMSMVYLGTQENCQANFESLDVSANQPVVNITDEGGAVVVTANLTPIGDNLIVGSMEMQRFLPNDGPSGSSTNGYCDLRIELQTRSSAGKTKAFGGNRLELIRLGCTVNQIASPSRILTCSPANTGVNDAVWNVIEDNGNQFANWTPFNGAGGLIIGAPSADIMGDDTAPLNMNMSGKFLGDATAPLIGTNLNHSLHMAAGGVFSDGSNYGFSSPLNPGNAVDQQCFELVYDWGGGDDSVEKLLSVCPGLVTVGEYKDTGITDKRTELQGRYSLMARDPLTFSHVSILSMGAPDDSYILSMNGYTYDPAAGGTTYSTTNFDGNAAFMVKANVNDNAVRWYMDRVNQPSPNDTEVLFGDDNLYEIIRFEPNFNVSFGDQTNILPQFAGAANGNYVWLLGERNSVHNQTSKSWLIGENNSVFHSTGSNNYEFIFGFTNSIEDAGDHNIIFGNSNIIQDGAYNFIFGGGNDSFADNGYTTLMGLSHYAGDDANHSFAVGEGAMLLNPGEVSFGKFPDNISTPEEQSIFTIGGGGDHSNRFNNLMLSQDGQLELKVGSLVTYAVNSPVFPLTGYIIPAQTSNDIGGIRNSSWITNNFKPICNDGGTSCDYFSYNTGDNQYGYAALELSDSGDITIYHRDRATNPSATATPGMVNPVFLTEAESGGNKIATISGDNVNFFAFFNNHTAGRDIDVNGTCNVQEYPISSDRRLKTKIKDLSVGLEQIMQLRPKSFRYKKNNQFHYGFIAQELKNVFSNLVKKIRRRGSDLKEVLSVGFSGLVAPTVKALFEIKQKLEMKAEVIKNLWQEHQELHHRFERAQVENALIIKSMCTEKILEQSLCP